MNRDLLQDCHPERGIQSEKSKDPYPIEKPGAPSFRLLLAKGWESDDLRASRSFSSHRLLRREANAAPAPELVRDVTLFTAQRTTVPDFVEATGTVRASQSAQLSSQVMGTITRVNVHEGDRVRRGEVLITIDEAQQRAAYSGANAGLQASQENIAAANADYALAESTMKRYQMLYDKKSVSPQEFDEVKARLAAAKARRDAAHAGRTQAEAGVSQASTAMGFTKIRAPFDGLVTAKLADAGAIATPGVPLLIVEDPGHFRLEATVDESKMGAVRLGEAVPVVIDALGEQAIAGKVVQIVPAADPASRTFTVKIDLADESANSLRAVRPRALSTRRARIHPRSANRGDPPRTIAGGLCRRQRSNWPACATSRWAPLPRSKSRSSPDSKLATRSSPSPTIAS